MHNSYLKVDKKIFGYLIGLMMVNLGRKISKIEVNKANIGILIMMIELGSLVIFEECSALIYMCKGFCNWNSENMS